MEAIFWLGVLFTQRTCGGGIQMNAKPLEPRGLAGRIAQAFINSKLTPLIIVASIIE